MLLTAPPSSSRLFPYLRISTGLPSLCGVRLPPHQTTEYLSAPGTGRTNASAVVPFHLEAPLLQVR